MDKTVPAFTYN